MINQLYTVCISKATTWRSASSDQGIKSTNKTRQNTSRPPEHGVGCICEKYWIRRDAMLARCMIYIIQQYPLSHTLHQRQPPNILDMDQDDIDVVWIIFIDILKNVIKTKPICM